MDLLQLPTELVYELFSYLPVDSIRTLYSTSKTCANLVGSFCESQRRVIKYCVVDAQLRKEEDRMPIYGPLEVIPGFEVPDPIDLGLNTYGARFSRAIDLRKNCQALAASDIVLIPFGWTSLHSRAKRIADSLAEQLLAIYVLLGSPNIHILIDGVMNSDMHKELFLLWTKEFKSAFQHVLGQKASHTKIIPINTYAKWSLNITEKGYDWYDGPTLYEILENSTKFRAPYSCKDILSRPTMIQLRAANPKLTLNLRGISDRLEPLNNGFGIVSPGEYGNYIFDQKRKPIKPPKVIISTDKLLTSKYGNCYCSLTVIKNQLRPRFSNEIYIAGNRFVIRVNLIAKIIDGKRTLIMNAHAGDQVEAIVTIMKIDAEMYNITILDEYIPNEDPLQKNIFGKFVVRDHWEVVFVGTIIKPCDLSQTVRNKFFDEDTIEHHETFGRNQRVDDKNFRRIQRKNKKQSYKAAKNQVWHDDINYHNYNYM